MQKIIFLGGDARIIYAINFLKSKGYNAESFGLFKEDCGKIEDADTVIFPVPATKNGTSVNCPLTDKQILFTDIDKKLIGKNILSGGAIPISESFINYCDDDYYAIQNAVPTAEGAISFCIENTPFTLFKSKILIIGNGRVAKVLISRLKAFRCDITVSARKDRDFALIDADGLKYINTCDVSRYAAEFDIIINTADVKLFDDISVLKNTLFVDLSSKGCLDFDKVKEKGINAYKLPGIPGKIAPITAGNILARTLYSFIKSKD